MPRVSQKVPFYLKSPGGCGRCDVGDYVSDLAAVKRG
jgi:hypothetical protein